MTSPSNPYAELIERLRSYVADGDAYGTRAKHPTTIGVRIDIEKAADRLSQLTRDVEEALPVFERVTRLADNLASYVPITAEARKHIGRAYAALTRLSREEK